MDYKSIVREKFKDYPERLKHTYGVVKRALELGKIYDADLHVLEVASLLHDVTKYQNLSFHKKMIADDEILLVYPEAMLHAFSGAAYAESLGIKDKKIIEAIKYHIFGTIDMNLETMILCVSDFSEENRTFLASKRVYELSLINLKEAYLLSLESTMNHLKEKGIEPLNIQKETYLYYKKGEGK